MPRAFFLRFFGNVLELQDTGFFLSGFISFRASGFKQISLKLPEMEY